MRYENPLYMVEDAGAADLIAGGRLQLGISRGSPEQVIDGWRYFDYAPADGETDADMARRHTEVFPERCAAKVRRAKSTADVPESARAAAAGAVFRRAARPHLVGRRFERHRRLGGEARHAPAKLDAQERRDRRTLPHSAGQADPRLPRRPKEAGHAHEPRVSVSRSIFALVDQRDRNYFGGGGKEGDQLGYIDAQTRAIFGRSYAAEPDVLIKQLAQDEAIAEADTLLLTVLTSWAWSTTPTSSNRF